MYLIPPDVASRNGTRRPHDGPPPSDVKLMYQHGGVLNVTPAAVNVTLVGLEVREGRHAGILATGARGLTIERTKVHSHGTVSCNSKSRTRGDTPLNPARAQLALLRALADASSISSRAEGSLSAYLYTGWGRDR